MHLYVVLGDRWTGGFANGKLQADVALTTKADAAALRDRLVRFEKAHMESELAMCGSGGRAPSADHYARVEGDFCVASMEVPGGAPPRTVFALVTETADDACFSGLFATAAEAEAQKLRAEEHMKESCDAEPADCKHAVKACPVLAALPASPFGIAPRDGYDFGGSGSDSGD